jgi:hypothetical protein
MFNNYYCRKQVEPEIGEIPIAFVAKVEGCEVSEDDVMQFVAKEVRRPPFECSCHHVQLSASRIYVKHSIV